MPVIRQFFVDRPADGADRASLELRLYVIRRQIENRARDEDLYIVCLSSNRVIYKGLILAHQLEHFYLDLADTDIASCFAMVHSRFSTNTLGTWRLAHPYRHVIHNGEINTLRGNINWMNARHPMLASEALDDDIGKLLPIVAAPDQSDTATFDNVLELLLATGRSLPHSMMMMIPEAWADHIPMNAEKKAFYEYHSSLMEPWDGPALMIGTDGSQVCAVLDRNGLRPCRFLVTRDDLLVMASETGVLDIPDEDIVYKSRIQPGRMFLLDTERGRLIPDEEIKAELSAQRPYGQWLDENARALDNLPAPDDVPGHDIGTLQQRQAAFGYTLEDTSMILAPMAENGAEAVGSMGNDTPLAVLSDEAPLLFWYFKQLFAQVSNPPLDAIREELVTSVESFIGCEGNLFDETPQQCRQLKLHRPVLTNADLAKIRAIEDGVRQVGHPVVRLQDRGTAQVRWNAPWTRSARPLPTPSPMDAPSSSCPTATTTPSTPPYQASWRRRDCITTSSARACARRSASSSSPGSRGTWDRYPSSSATARARSIHTWHSRRSPRWHARGRTPTVPTTRPPRRTTSRPSSRAS